MPWSVRVCDAGVVAFAAWTVSCHGVVLLGGGLSVLLPVALPVTLAALLWLRRLSKPAEVRPADAVLAAPWPAVAAVAAQAVCALWLLSGSVWLTWSASVLVLGGVWWRLPSPGGEGWPAAQRSPRSEAGLWVLCVAGALFGLFVHLPNIDDAYYLNAAVAAVDDASAPLLRFDTLHGIEGLPLMLPIYRFQSFELLGAVVAHLTPLSVIQAAHWIVPVAFGAFLPLALARLCRLLTPRVWLWTTLVATAVLLFGAETLVSHATTAFVRLQQGKGPLTAAWLPLTLVYAAEFARNGRARTWVLLCAVQIGALGLNATGVWAAPVFAGLALLAAARPDRAGLGRVAAGALASFYVLAIGLWVRLDMAAVLSGFSMPYVQPGSGAGGAARLLDSFEYVLGAGPFGLLCLGATLAAWGACRSPLSRRFLVLLCLGFLVFFFDPLLSDFVARNLTGDLTYSRLIWFLPIPVLLALVLVAPLELARESRRARLLGGAAVFVVTALVLGTFPRATVFDPRYYGRFEWLALKVQPEEYEAAGLLVTHVPRGAAVFAPDLVSVWVGTFPGHPYAVVPRAVYLEYLRPHLPAAEVERRLAMASVFGRRPGTPGAPSLRSFRRDLEHYGVRGVAAPSDRMFAPLRAALARWGYERVGGNLRYSVWVRPGPAGT